MFTGLVSIVKTPPMQQHLFFFVININYNNVHVFRLYNSLNVQALKDLYAHLTPIQRLTIARHPNRPTVLDHILNITDKDKVFTFFCIICPFFLISNSYMKYNFLHAFCMLKWVELHGDRAGYDDPAIVTGIGSIDGKSFMFIGHQKGRNTKENIERNFAMPTPHG